MAVGFPAKTTYADGDVFSASDINDTNGTLNLIAPTTNFAAGKNKIINGDFRINQRNFTSNTTSGVYNFDRWLSNNVDGTSTYSAQTFTPGAAPVSGYEAINYLRVVTSGQTLANAATIIPQKIEDVRTLAGQTATVSFYAQSGSGTPSISIEYDQQFGSGGSTRVTTFVAKTAINTSWTRYTATFAVPSISGKTIGTNSFCNLNFFISAGSDFNARTSSLGIQSNTFNIWGVQLEAGSTATAFQTATGTIQGELAACQRYYYRISPAAANRRLANGMGVSTTIAQLLFPFPVTMRTEPTALEQSGTASDYAIGQGSNAITCSSVPIFVLATINSGVVTFTAASGVTDTSANMGRTTSANAYLGWSAEL